MCKCPAGDVTQRSPFLPPLWFVPKEPPALGPPRVQPSSSPPATTSSRTSRGKERRHVTIIGTYRGLPQASALLRALPDLPNFTLDTAQRGEVTRRRCHRVCWEERGPAGRDAEAARSRQAPVFVLPRCVQQVLQASAQGAPGTLRETHSAHKPESRLLPWSLPQERRRVSRRHKVPPQSTPGVRRLVLAGSESL